MLFLAGRALVRPFLRVRYRPAVSGAHHIPRSGPVLLVSNHLSAIDTLLIPSFSPRRVQFLAKASLFRSPLGGWFFRSIGAVPVHREAGGAAQAALEAGRRVLAAGNTFAIFPEGSRSRDGRLYQGRGGAAWMALATGAVVIPVGLQGTNRALKDPRSGRPAAVSLAFGPPVDLSGLAGVPAGQARREATERIMVAIQALTGQERAAAYSANGRGA